MRLSHALRVALTALILIAAVANITCSFFYVSALPFRVAVEDTRTLTIHPRWTRTLPLPDSLRDGDRIDLASIDPEARTAIAIEAHLGRVPTGTTYIIPVLREGAVVRASVTSVDSPRSAMGLAFDTAAAFTWTLLAAISLLLIWRGRDRAAWGMALWSAAYVFGVANRDPHAGGMAGLGIQFGSILFYTLARAGFFVMVDALVSRSLTPHVLTGFRIGFGLLLAVGAAMHMGGPLLFVATGSAVLMLPAYSIIYSWIYLLPVAMLMVGYRPAGAEQRARLRWVLVSAIALTVSVTLTNTTPPGVLISDWIQITAFGAAAVGIAYALLRHRVVDVSIVVDRALVYGTVTALVVGVVAAMNSLALKLTLPPGTGWLLQMIVPLSLGIILGRVRTILDRVVEQVFFRRKYLAEKALDTFARHAGYMQDAPKLLDSAVREITRHLGAPAVAIYSAESYGYRRMKQAGKAKFPELLNADDGAPVALRADQKAVDLAQFESKLGDDGCVFPMMVLGNLRGLIVLKNRPHERYGSDERRLLTRVACDVGAAWRILRARDNEEIVVALAEGTLRAKALKQKAKALTLAWEGS